MKTQKYVYLLCQLQAFDPSNAKANFVQSTKMQRFLKKWKLAETVAYWYSYPMDTNITGFS